MAAPERLAAQRRAGRRVLSQVSPRHCRVGKIAEASETDGPQLTPERPSMGY
jgi:hypothetical protein